MQQPTVLSNAATVVFTGVHVQEVLHKITEFVDDITKGGEGITIFSITFDTNIDEDVSGYLTYEQ